MATQAQMDANRRNASHSTGPKTDEGKERSRTNATTHGLTAKVVFPDEVEAAKNQRLAAFTQILTPQGEIQELELEQAVLASLRFEHCQSSEIVRRIELASIARDSGPKWDEDRQKEAACLGKTLKRDPEIVMMTLRETPAGRAWLIAEWNDLLTTLEGHGPTAWSDAESNRALDLMGRSKNYRPQMIKYQAPFADPVATRALILERIAILKAAQQRDEAENARLRSSHVRGLITDSDAKLKLLRRYERQAQRCYDKNMTSLRKAKAVLVKAGKGQAKPTHETKPNPVAPEPCCETKPNPVAARPEAVVVEPAAKPDVAQPGNRKFRRQAQKSERHQEFLQRSRS